MSFHVKFGRCYLRQKSLCRNTAYTLLGGDLKTQNTRKRRRALTLVLLPVIVFIWFVGWSLYWIGSQRKTPEKESVPKEYNFTMLVIPNEQAIEAEN
jgi:hypothetical protein